jgi:hypothetical protein
VILVNWNQAVPNGDRLRGDLAGIGDGFIGIDDLNVLLNNWNAGTPPSAGTIIPEPATLAMFVSSLIAIASRRARQPLTS